jgi:small-conductance mechanosensitive channel
MGLMTDRVLNRLDDLEKYLITLETKIDSISKETNSLKNIELQITEIEKDINELKK